MRNWMMTAMGGLMVAGCGGSGGGGATGTVPVVTAPATPAPTASPTPSASPTPTPTPTASPTPSASPASSSMYSTYADLTGARTFQSACAGLLLSGQSPMPQVATGFGDGLVLGRGGSPEGYAVSGEGIDLSFASSALVSSTASQTVFERAVSGSTQRLSIDRPVAGGTALDYARSFTLRADKASGPSLYSCVFGVPAALADRPTASLAFARAGVTGTAYVLDEKGALRTYSVASSAASVSFDATTSSLNVQFRLSGTPQGGGAAVDLGNFVGHATLDGTRTRFLGQIDGGDRINLFSSFGGWFFGGSEAAAAFEILSADPTTADRMSVTGTLVAIR